MKCRHKRTWLGKWWNFCSVSNAVLEMWFLKFDHFSIYRSLSANCKCVRQKHAHTHTHRINAPIHNFVYVWIDIHKNWSSIFGLFASLTQWDTTENFYMCYFVVVFIWILVYFCFCLSVSNKSHSMCVCVLNRFVANAEHWMFKQMHYHVIITLKKNDDNL